MTFRLMASRHSAFYSPLLASLKFLKAEGHAATYSVLGPGQRSYVLLRDNQVDIMQSAVSSNWNPRERGVEPLPVHFAQINQRDGFFLVSRQPEPTFEWKQLEGRTLLADHGQQPLVMLKYAVKQKGVEWGKIRVVDAGTPEKMESDFREGKGDYLHQQAPVVAGEVVAAVGAAMPPVAFSSLCCARAYRQTEACRVFLTVYSRAREWVRTAAPAEVAAAESALFPSTPIEALAEAVERYQGLGCWDGGIEIPRDLYEQSLNVFQAGAAIAWRHRYEEVVG